jgi:hypothetical protein
MQRTLTRLLLLTSAGLFLHAASGCGSNQGCVDYATAICVRGAECSTRLGKINNVNLEACITSRAQTCELSTVAPDTNWRQETASACAQALSAAACDAVLDGPLPSSCLPAGNRGLGAACADAYQCQSLFCNRPTARDCGVCAPVHKEGEACDGGSLCDGGLHCAGLGTCAPLRKLNEACDLNFSCGSTLACSGGTCQPPAVGQPCASMYACAIESLQACDFDTMSCLSINYSVNKVGDSCGVDFLTGAIIACEQSGYCKIEGNQNFGVCRARPKEGEPCAVVSGEDGAVYQYCLSPTTCIAGICQIFDRASCG